jgi:glutamate synthase domain-containing protein 2
LVFNTGTLREKLDVQKSAQSLANYLLSCSDEMKLLAAALGHNHINRLSRADLCTTDPQLAKLLGIGFSGQPS